MSDELAREIVIPSGAPEHRKVGGGVFPKASVGVLAHRDVEDPVQAVPYAPIARDPAFAAASTLMTSQGRKSRVRAGSPSRMAVTVATAFSPGQSWVSWSQSRLGTDAGDPRLHATLIAAGVLKTIGHINGGFRRNAYMESR
ncbi:MAG: hypothetical protein H5U15_11225 [Roseovarius sp.]|nr:hypothetical protein [Roseovarius sp.]